MKQQQTYDDLVEKIMIYLGVNVHFSSQNRLFNLVIKSRLHYDWKKVFENELLLSINQVSDIVNNSENHRFIHFVHFPGVLKTDSLFVVKNPIFNIYLKDGVYSFSEDTEDILEYFYSIMNEFVVEEQFEYPEFEIHYFSDEFEDEENSYEEKCDEIRFLNLNYWYQKNKEKIDEGNNLNELDFPGLSLLFEIFDLLHYIGFLNYCLVNNKFDLKIEIPGIYQERRLGAFGYQKKKSSFNFRRKPEDLKNLYQFLIDESYIKEISFDEFSLCFSGQELQKPHLLEWNKTKVLLAYFINSLRVKDFIIIADEYWQKTAYCFKNINADSLKSSFSTNQYPKGFEEIQAFFDNY